MKLWNRFAPRRADPTLVRWEKGLCLLFFTTSFAQIWIRWNQECGYDAVLHLSMLTQLRWLSPIIGLHASFYAYHPPLGFLLARSIFLLGVPRTGSVQLLSLVASLLAFLCLRESLRHMQILSTSTGVTFLYAVAAIPMQRFLQRCVNLDVLILAVASMSLLLSLRLFKPRNPASRLKRWTSFSLIFVLLCGMMIKYSGVVSLSIPILTVLFISEKNTRRGALRHAFIIAIVAGALAFPYYFLRYFVPTHTFFPQNVTWLIGGWERGARHWRAVHPFLFLLNLFFGTPLWTHAIVSHSLTETRLWDTFRNFWVLGFSGHFFRVLSRPPYVFTMTFLMAIGGFAFIRNVNEETHEWRRFAWLLCTISAVFLVALFAFVFRYPYSGWGPMKGIYIAPALWGMGVLFCEFLLLLRRRLHLPSHSLFVFLAILIALQTVLLLP